MGSKDEYGEEFPVTEIIDETQLPVLPKPQEKKEPETIIQRLDERPLYESPLENKPRLMAPEVREIETKKFNQNPAVTGNGLRLVDARALALREKEFELKKKQSRFYLIMALVFLVLLAGYIVWTNLNISSGKMNGGNTTINVAPAEVQVQPAAITVDERDTNNYQHTINAQINLPASDKEDIIDEISERIIDEINGTN